MTKLSKLLLPVIFCLLLTFCLGSQKLYFSVGNRYYFNLQKWYQYANSGQWSLADNTAKTLNPIDIAQYRSLHHPDELKKIINTLEIAPNKQVEDWMELARIQAILGKIDESRQSITKAHELDPIRDDITQLYYQNQK